jgi:septal ring factor EnvC (AmiA/AmiB activator)
LLTDALSKTQESLQSSTEKYENEMKELKKLLLESQRREELLRQMNNEAYQLLTIYGVNHFTKKK